jgi:hypothetical protein
MRLLVSDGHSWFGNLRHAIRGRYRAPDADRPTDSAALTISWVEGQEDTLCGQDAVAVWALILAVAARPGDVPAVAQAPDAAGGLLAAHRVGAPSEQASAR